MNSLKLAALVVAGVLLSVPAFAQFDLTGKWASRSGQDAIERGPGPDPVDYLGLPLNDEGRARALSYDYSLMSLPEGQCGYHTPFYIVLGPFGLHIWNEFDPVTAKLVAWKIGAWLDRDVTTIWMDGRSHPSPNAPRTYGGFTTGRWEGETLITTTTHMKATTIRRNGAPVSDQATMTMYMVRHGDLLTIRAVMDDPVYFSEPLVRSRVWALDARGNLNLGNGEASPCEPIAELPRVDIAGVVPHHLPGQYPFVNELTEMYNIPVEAVLGGAETLYPEYRKKLKGYVPPAICKRYCGCGVLVCLASQTAVGFLVRRRFDKNRMGVREEVSRSRSSAQYEQAGAPKKSALVVRAERPSNKEAGPLSCSDCGIDPRLERRHCVYEPGDVLGDSNHGTSIVKLEPLD